MFLICQWTHINLKYSLYKISYKPVCRKFLSIAGGVRGLFFGFPSQKKKKKKNKEGEVWGGFSGVAEPFSRLWRQFSHPQVIELEAVEPPLLVKMVVQTPWVLVGSGSITLFAITKQLNWFGYFQINWFRIAEPPPNQKGLFGYINHRFTYLREVFGTDLDYSFKISGPKTTYYTPCNS
jgi:hypothetical protein